MRYTRDAGNDGLRLFCLYMVHTAMMAPLFRSRLFTLRMMHQKNIINSCTIDGVSNMTAWFPSVGSVTLVLEATDARTQQTDGANMRGHAPILRTICPWRTQAFLGRPPAPSSLVCWSERSGPTAFPPRPLGRACSIATQAPASSLLITRTMQQKHRYTSYTDKKGES